jgi:Fe2+ or Zn2+ uptake regulation protein
MGFVERAEEAINKSGGRMTTQRRVILEALAEENEQVDAEELHAHLPDESISLATVYRTLNTLEETGLIQARYASQQHTRKLYQVMSPHESYNFTCTQCGEVLPFKADLLGALRVQLEEQLGAQIDGGCICLSGLCPKCVPAQPTRD